MDFTGGDGGYLCWFPSLIFFIRNGNIIRQINISETVQNKSVVPFPKNVQIGDQP